MRVIHFVTGGFSGGATQVAIALVNAHREGDAVEPLLVLRHKRRGDPARIDELRAAGVPLEVVTGATHLGTVLALARLCRRWKPDVLVAHGFSEHLWGRYAGLLAKVPALVHVEHNTRERYTAWRRAQTRWLARRTARIVGCSEGVRRVLLDMGMPPSRTVAIPNGIRTAPFATARAHPLAQREAGIVMVARFSRQKDHATAGGGAGRAARSRPDADAPLRRRWQAGASRAGGAAGAAVGARIAGRIPGPASRRAGTADGPSRAACCRTHYEGMPLALIEGMAAGCAVVGSAVPGVRETLRDGVDGLLVPESDAVALADALERLLRDDALAERLGATARETALALYSRERMAAGYEAMLLDVARGAGVRD